MVADNDVARRFYEREGFTTTFVQMHRRLAPTGERGTDAAPIRCAAGKRHGRCPKPTLIDDNLDVRTA